MKSYQKLYFDKVDFQHESREPTVSKPNGNQFISKMCIVLKSA